MNRSSPSDRFLLPEKTCQDISRHYFIWASDDVILHTTEVSFKVHFHPLWPVKTFMTSEIIHEIIFQVNIYAAFKTTQVSGISNLNPVTERLESQTRLKTLRRWINSDLRATRQLTSRNKTPSNSSQLHMDRKQTFNYFYNMYIVFIAKVSIYFYSLSVLPKIDTRA